MKTFLKILGAFTGIALLLWFGHVRISGDPVGRYVENWTVAAWKWGVKTISEAEVFGKLSSPVKKTEAQVPKPTLAPIPDNGEKISAADRETLMKLLQ